MESVTLVKNYARCKSIDSLGQTMCCSNLLLFFTNSIFSFDYQVVMFLFHGW